MRLFFILLLIPLVEIALFIKIGDIIGLWSTLACIILTALAGTLLLRGQGFATLERLQDDIRFGKNPSYAIAHGVILLIAGVLLLTPGFFTDALGLAVMVPRMRSALIKWGNRKFFKINLHN